MTLRASSLLPAVLALLLPTAGGAQDNCTFSRAEDPPRQVVSCSGGLTVERELRSGVTISERSGSAPPRALEIENGAVFIDVAPGSAPTQIRTPHAIAAVRGTVYVVDVTAGETSVFVIEGAVTVRKTTDASTVTLRAGDGVDVRPGTNLFVEQWPATRVAALLSRFGR